MKAPKLALAGLLMAAAAASTALDKASYDRDGSDAIELLEYARYVLDLHSPPLSSFDANLNGRIDGAELNTASDALMSLEADVSPCVDDFSVDYPSGQALDEFVLQPQTCQLRDENFFEGDFPERMMVRASTEDLILFRPKSADVRRGAMFSFAHDLNKSINVASIKGALIRPINLVDEDDESATIRYLLPSVSVNLMSDESGKNQNVDTLSFRMAYETGFSTPHLDWARFGVSPVWTTDTGFDLDIRGADVQFEPTILGSGMNVSHRFGPVRTRWRGFLQAEYGKIYNPGEQANLAKGDYSSRAGGKLAMRLWPDNVFPGGIGKRLILDMEYLYLWELTGDLAERDYFELSISYLLDKAGHFRLQTRYTKGDATQALEGEESWTLGLGVLY
jgi:hypothetical protein